MTYEAPESHIHFISRALLRQGEDVILCRLKGKDWNFLPGGHVEDGESARSALARELVEELGEGDYLIGDLVGVCENAFPISETSSQHEVNFVFEVRVPTGISLGSQEDHLEFAVVSADSLREHHILPDSLKAGIFSFLETGKPFHKTSDSL
ncbi:MAG: NUDIX domain-containing protein [Candidatus Moranbacteria bacterium]|nr:NUDIX domain-containing protein [Candidatus Moranbacteria bacterium]NTW45804.1 NUDIX domain-containing protein [Candidatus Moranbacteria bacterium]